MNELEKAVHLHLCKALGIDWRKGPIHPASRIRKEVAEAAIARALILSDKIEIVQAPPSEPLTPADVEGSNIVLFPTRQTVSN